MIFGQQIQYTIDVIKAKLRPLDAGGDQKRNEKKLRLAEQYTRVVMQIVVSITIFGCCFYLLAKSEDESIQKACTGFIGAVVGYWLR